MGGKTILVRYKGKMYSLSDLERQFGIPVHTLRYRLDHGWDIEKIIDVGVMHGNIKKKCSATRLEDCFSCKLPDCTRSIFRPLEGELKYGENPKNMR